MKKWEKNPDISDNSHCTGHASGRIGNSAWHSLCYRGRSQDQFFQAYHDQGAEQNTEDHRSQKRAEDYLEEQQFQNRHCKQSRQAFCKICRKCYNYCSGKRDPLCLQG